MGILVVKRENYNYCNLIYDLRKNPKNVSNNMAKKWKQQLDLLVHYLNLTSEKLNMQPYKYYFYDKWFWEQIAYCTFHNMDNQAKVSKCFQVFLETTFVHVSCYPDHYEPKIFFRILKSAPTLQYTILD